ncbi:hypothetical protein GCK32_009408 [Trichostrongylus colubriformis]|uniref:Carboxylesterase type B domain-containing protein n=1 Tax=Trichostrongylus colubriformis TaxID=6319 RepID=A0AAN8FYN2_TRICO
MRHGPTNMLILLLLSTVTIANGETYVSVPTSYGVVQGRTVDYGNDRNQLYYGKADVFLGIPYAQPPVGDLRFRAPRQANPYNTVYDATNYRPKCPQANAGGNVNEDCLYLNVFTQKAGNQSATSAVMVFIDGSNGFGQGGWDESTQKGMVQALRWVKTEIVNFGGDPNRITIAGQGDGGCAVSAHTLSPLSQNLFNQAIIQSGPLQSCYSSDLPMAIPQQTTQLPVLQYDPGAPYPPNTIYYNGIPQQRPQNQGYYNDPSSAYNAANAMYDVTDPSQQLAQQLCNVSPGQWQQGNVGNLRNCLHNYTIDVFMKNEGKTTAAWMIVRDDAFLPDSIENLAARRPRIPIIIGTVQDENADYAFKLLSTGESNESQDEMFNNWMLDFARQNRLDPNSANKISQIISQNYNVTPGPLYDTSTPVPQYNYNSNQMPSTGYQPNGAGYGTPVGCARNQCQSNVGCVPCSQNPPGAPTTFGGQTPVYYDQNGNINPNGGYPNSAGGYPTQNYQNSNYGNQNSGYGNQNVGYSNQKNGYGTQNPGYNQGQPAGFVGGYEQGGSQYHQPGSANEFGVQYDQNSASNTHSIVNNPQTVASLKSISQISSDAGTVSQTVTEIDSFLQNGNQYVRVYQFTHVTDLGRQNVPDMGSWKPVYKGQDMIFLFMSETIQVSGWQPSNAQEYTYCNLNRQPTVQNGYAQQARNVFNNQVDPIIEQAHNAPQRDAQPLQTQPTYTPTAFTPGPAMNVKYQSNGPQSSTFQFTYQLRNVPGK